MFFLQKVIDFFKGRQSAVRVFMALALVVLTAASSAPHVRTVFMAQGYAAKRKIPIYSVDTPQKKVSVTFDSAWEAGDTEEILTILKDNGVKASFFLCGTWMKNNPDLLRKIYEDGHDIGNHGDTHAHVAALSLEQNKKEITGAHDKVYNALGISMNLFRPPYGEYNDTVVTAADELGYYSIQWNIDSLDWKNLGEKDITDRVLNSGKLVNGSIILFHSDAEYTAAVLDKVIKGLKEMGYEIVPVSELIYKNNFIIDHSGRQKQVD